MNSGRPEITAEGWTFSYQSSDEPRLRNITFSIATGERVAIMGATGAGKTTLAMSMNGLVPHHHEGTTSGRLVVAGLDVVTSEIHDLVRHVGLVMQDAESQITGRFVREDATVGPANLGLPRVEVFARADAALQRVGLGDLADRDTAQLSGGQQQRLAMAGILAMDPQLLVLDEPTSELDPASTEQVFALVREISAETGRTVLFVGHEPEFVATWADRLLVLADGAVVFDGPPVSFFAQPELVTGAGLRSPGATEVIQALRSTGLLPGAATPVPLDVSSAAALLACHTPRQVRAPSPPTVVPANGRVVVRAESIEHRYASGVLALDGVDLEVEEGEFVALLGCNGAGKTTFARHLNGLLRPTAGRVLINGAPTSSLKVHELATQVGYVFQNPDHQIFAASVRDEIAFGLKNQGQSAEEIEIRVAEVLAQVGMSDLVNVHPYRLGKGQRQRLAVASVLALRPGILVIDEPTTGQDWTGSLAMMELVRELNHAGHTILMITHDMLLAARYARRAVVFNDGHLQADLAIHDLFTDARLLADAHLRPPQLVELAMQLGLPPVASAEEFVRLWGDADAP